MALSSSQVHLMNHQVAANSRTHWVNLGSEFARRLPVSTAIIAIYYYYSDPKARTHFTVPRRVEG